MRKKLKEHVEEESPLPCTHCVCFAACSSGILNLNVHCLALKNFVHISWLSESVPEKCLWYFTCNLKASPRTSSHIGSLTTLTRLHFKPYKVPHKKTFSASGPVPLFRRVRQDTNIDPMSHRMPSSLPSHPHKSRCLLGLPVHQFWKLPHLESTLDPF